MTKLEQRYKKILKEFDKIISRAAKGPFEVSNRSDEHHYCEVLEDNGVLKYSGFGGLGTSRYSLEKEIAEELKNKS